MDSRGPLHMDDQIEHIYNNSVPIQDVAMKTFRELYAIETDGDRRSGSSMLTA